MQPSIERPKRRITVVLIAFTALATAAISCGGNENDPVSGDQPGTTTSWNEVARRLRCAPDSELPCVSGKFVATSGGDFRFENTSTRGRLSAEDLRILNNATEALMPDLGQELNCQNNNPSLAEVASEMIDITPRDGDPRTVLEVGFIDSRRCTRGDKQEIARLQSVLSELMRKLTPDNTGGTPYDPCESKACGDRCTICSPDDFECVETQVLKFCSSDGECRVKEPACELNRFN